MAINKILFEPQKNETPLDYLIWNMFLYWLVIDCITGYFLNSGLTLPISQVYKLFLTIILIFRIVKQNNGLQISLIIIYVIIYFIHISLINENVPSSLIHISKIFLTFLIYVYLSKAVLIYKRDTIILRSYTILNTSFYLISINILLGLIGIGFNTYPDEGIGYKGFFFAGNEIGGLFAVLIPFKLYNTYKQSNIYAYLLSCAFCALLAILLGTKSVILVTIITCFMIPWIYGNSIRKLRIVVILILICLITLPMIINLISSQDIDLLVRMTYSYNKGGVSSLLLSSRDEFWILKREEFFNSNIWSQLFGLGGNRTVEMDQFDALLNYGYVGLILIYLFYSFMFIKSWNQLNNNTYTKVINLSNIMLLGMSIIAGHILFSSMAGMYICLNNNLSNIFLKAGNLFKNIRN